MESDIAHSTLQGAACNQEKKKELVLAFIFWGDLLVFVCTVRNSFTTVKKKKGTNSIVVTL